MATVCLRGGGEGRTGVKIVKGEDDHRSKEKAAEAGRMEQEGGFKRCNAK